jgi:deoxyribodipyrimidine photo-lyase
MAREDWSPAKLAEKATGSAHDWWGASVEVEAFLDQLITWRELGFNLCWQRDDYDRYESLPAWARQTLAERAKDPRPHVYEAKEFEAADTVVRRVLQYAYCHHIERLMILGNFKLLCEIDPAAIYQ